MKRNLNKNDWQRFLVEYQSSNLTVIEFCRLKRVSVSRFYYWRSKLKFKDDHPTKRPVINKDNNNHIEDAPSSNFISVSEKVAEKKHQISFIISGHEISFSSLPDPAWIAKLIVEVGNESASA